MNFRMRAAPISTAAIGHTSRQIKSPAATLGRRSNRTDPRGAQARDAIELRRPVRLRGGIEVQGGVSQVGLFRERMAGLAEKRALWVEGRADDPVVEVVSSGRGVAAGAFPSIRRCTGDDRVDLQGRAVVRRADDQLQPWPLRRPESSLPMKNSAEPHSNSGCGARQAASSKKVLPCRRRQGDHAERRADHSQSRSNISTGLSMPLQLQNNFRATTLTGSRGAWEDEPRPVEQPAGRPFGGNRMDPLALVLTALSAGAATGLKDSVSSTITDRLCLSAGPRFTACRRPTRG